MYRRVINSLKNIHYINILVKKINACRKVEIKCIEDQGNFLKTDKVLDIGSGDGYWTNYFGKKCLSITGIEPYEDHLKIAQKKYSQSCKFVLGSAEALNFGSNSFDKVIGVCVFEHLYNDEQAFTEIYRVLKPGGKILATVDSLNSKYISEKYKKKHMRECYCAQLYSTDSIKEKLKKSGFENIQANYIIGSYMGILYEKLSEKFGALSYIFLLPLYPIVLLMEKTFKESGYKIFVSANKIK